MEIIAIAAADQNWGIGQNGGLLLHLPPDMRFFKETTTGNTVLMGRKTLESFPGGRPLPHRANLVLTQNPAYAREGVTVCPTPAAAFQQAKALGRPLYVIGGGSVYRQLLPYCQTALITKIEGVFPADTFFPNLDADPNWVLADPGEVQEHKGVLFRFARYIQPRPRNMV